jgi:hypothetical protein
MQNGTYNKQATALLGWIEDTNPHGVNVPADLVWMATTFLQDETIVWVSSNLDAGFTQPAGEVIIFTEQTIVRIQRDDEGALTTVVTGRSDIRNLSFVGLPEHEWKHRTEPSWPSHARVVLTLADGSTLTVPAGERR